METTEGARILVCVRDTPLGSGERAWSSALPASAAYADTPDHALSMLGGAPYDVIVLVPTDPGDLSRLVAACAIPVVVYDHTATVHGAVKAMHEGAAFYVSTGRELSDALTQVIDAQRPDLVRPLWRVEERAIFARIVNRSAAMNQVIERLRAIAKTPQTTALVLGESGVGKELVATAIHALSSRSGGPFVPIDCSAIPETLIESELFGHDKGAFTGAHETRVGRMEMANGGSLFLDEIGELPLHLQAKLLRALEERRIWRVGASESRPIDVRVIAATNRSLEDMVEQKKFRADLYYRLKVFVLDIPPLRARGADVLHLADHFIAHFNRELGRDIEGLTPAARARLVAYDFPGNVRELKNIIEQAIVSCSGTMLDARDLELTRVAAGALAAVPIANTDTLSIVWGDGALQSVEREAIRLALARSEGNQTRAAQMLGIQRLALGRAMTKHGLLVTRNVGRPAKPRTV